MTVCCLMTFSAAQNLHGNQWRKSDGAKWTVIALR